MLRISSKRFMPESRYTFTIKIVLKEWLGKGNALVVLMVTRMSKVLNLIIDREDEFFKGKGGME